MQQIKAYGTYDVISQLVQLRVPGQQLSQLHKPQLFTVPAYMPVVRENHFSILDLGGAFLKATTMGIAERSIHLRQPTISIIKKFTAIRNRDPDPKHLRNFYRLIDWLGP
jgi:hypothetical protein